MIVVSGDAPAWAHDLARQLNAQIGGRVLNAYAATTLPTATPPWQMVAVKDEGRLAYSYNGAWRRMVDAGSTQTITGTKTFTAATITTLVSTTGTITGLTTTNLDVGASGTAGSIDLFPATASKGKVAFSTADNAGNTTTGFAFAAQSGAWTYTVPDAGASASFVMTEGAQTVNGVKTFGSMFKIPVNVATAATGSTQTDAAQLSTGFTRVTAADGTKGVKLAAATAGIVHIIKNGAAAVLKIWPASGDAINALAVDASFDIAANTSVLLIAEDGATHYSVPLLPS